MVKNPNHPRKGQSTTVDPIRKLENVKAIKKLVKGNPRDHLLFVMGVNNGLRAGDLLELVVGDVVDCKPGDVIKIVIANYV